MIELESKGADYRVHKNGSLIFRRAEKSQEGEYACKARNKLAEETSKFVELVVEGKVEIVDYPDVIRTKVGTPLDLNCVATGDPAPVISWLRDGRPVIN